MDEFRPSVIRYISPEVSITEAISCRSEFDFSSLFPLPILQAFSAVFYITLLLQIK